MFGNQLAKSLMDQVIMKKILIFRRSLFATKNIKKGDLFTSDNIGIFRPNIGLQPKEFDKIVIKNQRKVLKKDLLYSIHISKKVYIKIK